ncbi:hypothetical protein CTI12_AA491990 [Artemisia annua]|uniref:Regulator of chromosome condensation 1/beta-lactamase-inhibitor protein II n=1 Tax=Artemisia annua TaxID=35608 RepID=A0A2U1LBA1_ARTAN|nr:hypothetical protein CTI12_AA491990 [Artemisia annua]
MEPATGLLRIPPDSFVKYDLKEDLFHRRVKAIAAAKHHTVAATEGGEVFIWEGQLGYTSVETQATPRRVSSLKSKIVAVAAANKHTVVVRLLLYHCRCGVMEFEEDVNYC